MNPVLGQDTWDKLYLNPVDPGISVVQSLRMTADYSKLQDSSVDASLLLNKPFTVAVLQMKGTVVHTVYTQMHARPICQTRRAAFKESTQVHKLPFSYHRLVLGFH